MFEDIKKDVLGKARGSEWFKPEGLEKLDPVKIEIGQVEIGLVSYRKDAVVFANGWEDKMPPWHRKHFPRAALCDGLLGNMYFNALNKGFNDTVNRRLAKLLEKVYEIGAKEQITDIRVASQRVLGEFEQVFGKNSPLAEGADLIIGQLLSGAEPGPGSTVGKMLDSFTNHHTNSRSTSVAYLFTRLGDGEGWAGARDVLTYKAFNQKLDMSPYIQFWHEHGPRRALEQFETFEFGPRNTVYHG